MQIISSTQKIQGACAIALGMFDGVHLGHQEIIKQAVDYAKSNSLKSVIITLSEHPKTLTIKAAPPLINSLDTRLNLFEELGLDYALVLDFTEELMNMSPKKYLETFVKEQLNGKFISVGFNHHFGHNRSGSVKYLEDWCQSQGIQLKVLPEFHLNNESISSSKIRTMIQSGLIIEANKLLGYDFFIKAKVIRGAGIGKQIGFPTINLEIQDSQIKPGTGVYQGYIEVNGEKFKTAINIGHRPTISISGSIQVEAHILNFDQDLYGQNIRLFFEKKLRNEKKFSSIEELQLQIKEDIARIQAT